MAIKEQTGFHVLESIDDFAEARVEAVGFIFHGTIPLVKGKGSVAANLLHFARCPRLEKIGEEPTKIWYRSVRVAHKHLDDAVGEKRWKWCKYCEREITQRILDEA
jgi:hypothetical protein